MTKTDLIEVVQQETGLTKAHATKAVNAVFQGISMELEMDCNVSIHGFGKFEPVRKAARPGRNPRTGETVTIPARNAVKFTAAKQLKDEMN